MSERLDRAIAALDVGLQDSPESHVYSDVAPTMVDTCVRCQRRDRFEESDFCAGCRSFLLGDGPDPMVWSPGSDGGTYVPRSGLTEYVWPRAPRGGIRYIPPPDFVQWDRDVRMGIARTELTGWSDVARYVDQLRREEHLPESLPLRVTVEPRDHLGVTLSVEWSSAALALTSTLDVNLWRDSSILGPRNDLQLFTEEWVSVAQVGAEDVSWTFESGGVPYEYAEEWRRLGVGPMPCPNRYARPVVHHRDGNRWNNAPENLAVVDPRENARGATADVARQIQGIIDEDGQLTEPWRSVVEQQRDTQLAHDLDICGEAFTDEDGNRLDPSTVVCGVYVDAAGTVALNPLEPFCRDADGNVALRWSPPLGTGDPLTDPIAAAREEVARQLAEYTARHPFGNPPMMAAARHLDALAAERVHHWDADEPTRFQTQRGH